MRGKDEQQLDVFRYISPEQRVPHDHPLRPLRVMFFGIIAFAWHDFNNWQQIRVLGGVPHREILGSPVWAGVLPLEVRSRTPVPDDNLVERCGCSRLRSAL